MQPRINWAALFTAFLPLQTSAPPSKSFLVFETLLSLRRNDSVRIFHMPVNFHNRNKSSHIKSIPKMLNFPKKMRLFRQTIIKLTRPQFRKNNSLEEKQHQSERWKKNGAHAKGKKSFRRFLCNVNPFLYWPEREATCKVAKQKHSFFVALAPKGVPCAFRWPLAFSFHFRMAALYARGK